MIFSSNLYLNVLTKFGYFFTPLHKEIWGDGDDVFNRGSSLSIHSGALLNGVRLRVSSLHCKVVLILASLVLKVNLVLMGGWLLGEVGAEMWALAPGMWMWMRKNGECVGW